MSSSGQETALRILFVDDDKNVLQAMERGLYMVEQDWEMSFSSSGHEALAELETDSFDVLVTDMRMPGMDGAALLREAKRLYPHIFRIVLTGQVDYSTAMQSVDLAHQFLSKPCNLEELQAVILRATHLRNMLSDPRLKAVIGVYGSLPSIPKLLVELNEELALQDASVRKVSVIIGRDVAMTARILQIVNSALFGLRNHIDDVAQAVSTLGLDIIRALMARSIAFTQIAPASLPNPSFVENLSCHCLNVGMCMREILQAETGDAKLSSLGCSTGILHDLGKLVLAADAPVKYADLLEKAAETNTPLNELERDSLGTSHAPVGAYLLGLWGLPDPVVEGIAFHHAPRSGGRSPMNLATLTHVTDYIVHRIEKNEATVKLDLEYLHEIGLQQKLADWIEICQRTCSRGSDDA